MIDTASCMREGANAALQSAANGTPLKRRYSKGTRRHFWWSRGVELASSKIAEIKAIGR